MQDIKIDQIEFLEDYTMKILLCNGHRIIYDMKPKLKTIRFADLKEKEVFTCGQLINNRIIRWNISMEISLEEILNRAVQG